MTGAEPDQIHRTLHPIPIYSMLILYAKNIDGDVYTFRCCYIFIDAVNFRFIGLVLVLKIRR